MKYRYCSVLPVNQHTIYSYIADMDVQVHAFVEIPFGASNQITQGIVMEVTECTAETAPFPVEKTKHISRLITEDEYRKNIKEPDDLFEAEDIAEDLTLIEAMIEENDLDGIYHWAMDHQDQMDEPQVRDKVIQCYEICIEHNNPLAALNLGSIYYDGLYVEQDYKKAAALYEIAAKAGERQAFTNLGYCYYYGRHQEKDYAKAMQYYMLGALLYNDANCLYKLGDMYGSGLFVPKNSVYAFKLYDRAFHALRDGEDEDIGADIRFRIGKSFLYGDGIAKNVYLAFTLLSQALSGFYARRDADPFVGKLIRDTKALIREAEDILDQEIVS